MWKLVIKEGEYIKRGLKTVNVRIDSMITKYKILRPYIFVKQHRYLHTMWLLKYNLFIYLFD